MTIKLVILAGGLATRVMPLTDSTPKCLLPILGRPFVDYQFDIFRKNSFFDITFCLGHLGTQVQKHITQLNARTFGNSFKLEFSHDGPQSLGTGGAIAKSLRSFSGNFAVMYGDSYLTANLQEVVSSFQNHSEFTQITVTGNVSNLNERNVVIQGGAIRNLGKSVSYGTHAEYGFTLINRNSIEKFVSSNSQTGSLLKFDLTDFLNSELEENKLKFYETPQPYWEVGSFDGINRFEKYMRESSDVRY